MTQNRKLQAWVNEIAAMCKPDRVHWCDGSQKENDELCRQMVVPLDRADQALDPDEHDEDG